MKRFYNSRETVVAQAIDGLLRSSAGAGLCRLDGDPDVQVVLRRDWDRSRVAIISGGGSGHEPAHAGFVGPGMLTAAVCGALFASPSVDAILAAILAVTGSHGALLIVKNYTGDRLNFGLAAEQARALGHKVEVVIVADDVALDNGASARGLAGTTLVQKVAGHLADTGAALQTVTDAARETAQSVRSIGLALTGVNVFDPDHDERLEDGEAEIGLGIHGEPGAEKIPMASLDSLMQTAAARLEQGLGPDRHAILINTLGAVPPIEASLLADAFSRTELADAVDWIIGPAPVMTSLDMVGFSLTTLPLTPQVEAALRAAVPMPAWPEVAPFAPVAVQPMPDLPETFTDAPSNNATLRQLFERGAKILIDNEKALNALDARIGDGDAGSTFADSARQIRDALDRLPLGDPQKLFGTLGRILARHSGGSSGVLLSILFATAARNADWRAGLADGVKGMQTYGGASEGDRTMLDALIPAIAALHESGLAEAAKAARTGADATRAMPARAGRAAYVPQSELRDTPDPGAEAIARLLEGLVAA
jgi:ATP-dependent dihydroxyacetone kinase